MFRGLARIILSLFSVFGRASSTDCCRSLEDQLKADPDSIASREKVIQCYEDAAFRSYSQSPSKTSVIAKKHAEHMFWMVQHVPEEPFIRSRGIFLPFWDTEDHARVKSAWMEHLRVRANDVQILLNAVCFFRSPQRHVKPDPEKAEELVIKAHSLDPKNAEVCTTLAEMLELKMLHASPEQKKQLASEALQLREQAIQAAPTEQKYAQLKGLALDAFNSDNEVKAQTYAAQLLELSRDDQQWSPDMAFHAGNVILGRIALKRGNLDEAKARLLEAGKLLPTAIPVLPRFGPNMMLAKELLERQQKEIVLQYFDACEKFWPEKAKLDQWREIARQGGMPEFGTNLFC